MQFTRSLMSSSGKRHILMVLAALTVCPSLGADGSPYDTIGNRNVFGLRPAPLPAPPLDLPSASSAKITLQGITTILGRRQVLMRVQLPAKPPTPAIERALVLSEGESDGDIKVVAINAAKGTVQILNQGAPLMLDLENDADKPTVGTPGSLLASAVRGSPSPAINLAPNRGAAPPGASSVTMIGNSSRTTPRFPLTSPQQAAASVGPNSFGGTVANTRSRSKSDDDALPPMTPVEQTIMIEAMAEVNRDQINAGLTPPPPVTRFPKE